MEIIDQLANTSLFRGLAENHLKELAGIAGDRSFRRGQAIFYEGDPGKGFYVVISGRVKIYKVSPEGKEQILHIFEKGEPFAEVAVFTGVPYPANAVALDDCRVFFFPKDAFVALIRTNPDLAMNMLATLSQMLRRFSNLIEALSLKEVPGRLASHLLFLSAEHGNASDLKLGIPKAQLASLLGTIPETLSRIFAKMSREGLLKLDGPRITLLDRQGLEELASGETRL